MDLFDSIAIVQTNAQLDFVLYGDRTIRRHFGLGMKPTVIVMLPGARAEYEGLNRMDVIPVYAEDAPEAAQTIERLLGANAAHIGDVKQHVVALRDDGDDAMTARLEELSPKIKVATLRTAAKLRA